MKEFTTVETVFDLHEKKNLPLESISIPDSIPSALAREKLDFPDISEPELVRHYTSLSRMNFSIDQGMYPLGSCTMKYNPRFNERVASYPAFTASHPLQPDEYSPHLLSILYELSEFLKEVTGLPSASLVPVAGAHGELTSVMMIKKYFEDRGEKRRTILVADSAHGTNPASVAMCGFDVKTVPSGDEGDVDIEALKELLTKDVAAMMLTSPGTLGLFDRNIITISEMLHENGSLFYGDGANFNALIGTTTMGGLGFDVIHLNLHKTFSTPHGGGGPGAGPVLCTEELAPYLPLPRIEKKDTSFSLRHDAEKSIGHVHGFHGNILVLIRAWAYLKRTGRDGLRKISEDAVLSANYLKEKLKALYYLPYDRPCMHEFVLSDKGMPNDITTNDIAKGLLDRGIHAPTVYFPLIVEGAMMIEPTETEPLESLDRFIEAMKDIHAEATTDPENLHSAPHTTPVGRVDAVTAARKPILTWDMFKENLRG